MISDDKVKAYQPRQVMDTEDETERDGFGVRVSFVAFLAPRENASVCPNLMDLGILLHERPSSQLVRNAKTFPLTLSCSVKRYTHGCPRARENSDIPGVQSLLSLI